MHTTHNEPNDDVLLEVQYPALSDAAARLVGTRQILRAAMQQKLQLVILAEDVDTRVRTQIVQVCQENDLPYLETGTMEQLGKACRIAVGAAAAGLLKPT